MNESLTLMICTYDRPQHFKRLIESLGPLIVPEHAKFQVVVCDNNTSSMRDAYVGQLLSSLAFETRYGHESRLGYSNARNKALELALETPSDLFAFVDDDFVLDPDWLTGQFRTYDELDCDVVRGAIRFSGEAKHGRRLESTGAGNTSFRRRLVDPEGWNLRFDPRFNTTGGEDGDFFSRAAKLGARIVHSTYPVAINLAGRDNPREERLNKIDVAALGFRNRINGMRDTKGWAYAATKLLSYSALFGVKATACTFDAWASATLGRRDKADERRLTALKHRRKIAQGWIGLFGSAGRRQDVRRR